jgi:hypothetical protein
MLKRLPQDRLEDESIGAVASFFNSSGWEFNKQARDKSGIDGEVEIVHGIERTGRLLKCQIKAGTSYISSEGENHLKIRIERKYLEHWAKMSVPVLLLFYHPASRLIFWKAIREFLDLYPSLLAGAGESCVIGFDKDQDRLETESLAALEALEAGRFRYDNILIERSRSELGWSNWFPVNSFPTLWQADTDAGSRPLILPHLSHAYAFTIQGNQLLTFCNLRHDNCELRNFVHVESIHSIPLDDIPSPVTVELLSQMLFIFAKRRDLAFGRERFYFSAALLKTPEGNKFSYLPLKRGKEETRTKIYIQRLGTGIEYKHHAVRLSFLQHLGKWYLQVDPDWYFTYPFRKRPPRLEIGARITSEKASTHNKDFLYLIHFWRQFLSNGQETIEIPCSDLEDGNTVDIAKLPLEFEFKFRFFNDYVGPKTTTT